MAGPTEQTDTAAKIFDWPTFEELELSDDRLVVYNPDNADAWIGSDRTEPIVR